MQIGVPAETTAGETRVAVTPETAKKLKAQGHTLRVQSGAGLAASVTDEAYQAAGAEITDAAGAFGCELVLKVRTPSDGEAGADEAGRRRWSACSTPSTPTACSAWPRRPHRLRAGSRAAHHPRAEHGRAVSSQANIAGYKAVMIAANLYQRFFPMLMTAAGTVKAARVVILGVGVAGLQAIATAKRLGAVIEASRRAARA